eukprot:TRINITY_DN4000_c0_g1_i2.p1 TRINITY_DN4000_c0_g1~~TRINITY_DN4000_c0_g1_i2.p1  ORF type:complete len:393 (+),score=19.05 TRINITY_DN4000_c0_g1_i2:86-1264(+)
MDPSAGVVVGCAVVTLVVGANRALYFWKGTPGSAVAQVVQEASANDMKLWTAVLLPVFGSIMLLALFFFLNWLKYLLLVLFAFAAFTAVIVVLSPLFDLLIAKLGVQTFIRICPRQWWDEPFPTSALLGVPVALTAVVVWAVWHPFLVTDFLALSLGVTAMTFLRLPSLRIAFVILTLFFFYDIFWVFLSPFLFHGENVMVKVATGLPSLPIVILVPRILTDGYSLLGMGDITLPGLYLAYLRRFDDSINHGQVPWYGFYGYFGLGLCAYTVGLLGALVALVFMHMAQPALLYIVPAILIPTMLISWWNGQFRELWIGHPAHHDVPAVETAENARDIDVELGHLEGTPMSEPKSVDGYTIVPLTDAGEHQPHDSETLFEAHTIESVQGNCDQ